MRSHFFISIFISLDLFQGPYRDHLQELGNHRQGNEGLLHQDIRDGKETVQGDDGPVQCIAEDPPTQEGTRCHGECPGGENVGTTIPDEQDDKEGLRQPTQAWQGKHRACHAGSSLITEQRPHRKSAPFCLQQPAHSRARPKFEYCCTDYSFLLQLRPTSSVAASHA